ncbi:MAG TPA: glycerate kinase [Verrucomicrobiae bacterium]|nr:glycerate kinase [Verrucomicrobiae bacterium]
MKIVVALDKFKGSLTAPRACEIVREAILSVRPDVTIVVKPMADGGDGTAEVFRSALGGEWVQHEVTGPLPGMLVNARYLWLAQERLAVVEMAQASGLVLLKPEQRNPLRTHSHGTGELLCYAASRGAQRILLAVGGSATIDGGVGAARAGGWRFVGANGKQVELGGGELGRIVKIEDPKSDPKLDEEDFLNFSLEVLCDVDNPLCGERGAARVFGPQKGATPEMVEQLDAGLRHLAELVKTQLGKDIADVPGAGAAGGLAFGALAFMDAKLIPGVEAVAEAIGLKAELADADWIITGEGRFDEQSFRGKVVSGVAKLASQHGVKVGVLAGSVSTPDKVWHREGIALAMSTMTPGMKLEEAIASAEPLLESAARRLAAGIVV